ncbi:MAG TPA: response regulator [Bryobacteraceae bacterium]|nr:response regulator [Bryobacteraceae bacterium]
MRETILVVEDGDAVRNLVCRMLVQNGYRVLEACDGRDALRLCETHPDSIELVLTDLVMPHMAGSELAERLRRARPALRILVMSGYTDEPLMQRLGRESLAFLAKPFTSVDLVEKVRQVLDSPWNGLPTERPADG